MSDLRDCLRHIHKKAENNFDEQARKAMIDLFDEIAVDWDGDVVEFALNL